MTAPDDDQGLLDLARQAAEHAYAPYSGFPVGAALLTPGGAVYVGANVENAAYGLTVCAERSAVSALVMAGHQDRAIAVVAVVGLHAAPCFPCGACRQVLHEFGCTAVVVEEDAGAVRYPFDEILPHGFGRAALTGHP